MANYLTARWFKNGNNPYFMFRDLTKEKETSSAYQEWIKFLYLVKYRNYQISDEWLKFTHFKDWYYQNRYNDTRYYLFSNERNISSDVIAYIPFNEFRVLTTMRKGVIVEYDYGDNLKQYEFRFTHFLTKEKTESNLFNSIEEMKRWIDDYIIENIITFNREREIYHPAISIAIEMLGKYPISERVKVKRVIVDS